MYFDIAIDKTPGFYTYYDKENLYQIGQRVIVFFGRNKKTGLIVRENKKTEYDFKVSPILKAAENYPLLSKEFIDLLLWVSSYYLAPFERVLEAALPGNIKAQYKKYYLFDPKLFWREKLFKNNLDSHLGFSKELSYTKATLAKKLTTPIVNEYLAEDKLILTPEKKLTLNRKEWERLFQLLLASSGDINSLNEFPLLSTFRDKIFVSEHKGKEFLEKMVSEGLTKKEINNSHYKFSLPYFKVEARQGRVGEDRVEANDASINKTSINETKITLTPEQIKVANDIETLEDRFFLLYGITGSGKTEVYLDLIKKALKNGSGSIFLVPEISITPQMIARFSKEFGNKIAILHSKLTPETRKKEWLAIESGEKKVVLGVRSAIFAPVKRLKYIILDEEHEGSYKQDTTPHYNARQVAIKRALLEGAKVIMGSATPSVESFTLAKNGTFKLLELKKRFNDNELPDVELIDMCQVKDSLLSEKLLDEIAITLRKKEQVMILLNRKGFATYVQCSDCGHVEECPNCSITLNYFKSTGKYKCNYCGFQNAISKCSKCQSENLIVTGQGTERLEEELKVKFPEVGVVRVDSQANNSREFYENTFKDFASGKYQIMVGTQLIAKGLNFPKVTLVGVINSDVLLNFPDFRSSERTFQLVHQVSGRGGRGQKKGKTLIQTYQPDNKVMQAIKNNNYLDFFREELPYRELLNYPPYGKLINIVFSSSVEEGVKRAASNYYKILQKKVIELKGDEFGEIYHGPAPINKIKGRYRYRILIKGSRKEVSFIKKIIASTLAEVKQEYRKLDIRMIVDVDPNNLN